MVSFENFVKSLPPSLSELKVKPIFCFPIKIRDDPAASSMQHVIEILEINLYFLSLRSPNVSVQRRGSTPLGERRRTRSASPAITDTTRVAVGSVQAALHKR